MGEASTIGWTDATWNPWYGCSKVSPGCDSCYAERQMNQYGKDFDTVQRAAKGTFYAPLKWKEPRMIFTCSWSDFFHRDAEPWLDEAMNIIRQTPQHTYQILTKRPGRMKHWADRNDWPQNAWAGVSIESEKYLPRLLLLERVSAAVRFVSAEPLLGPLRGLWLWMIHRDIHWVIAGGESGSVYRALDLDWVRNIRDQCQKANVPFFYKQGSGPRPGRNRELDGRTWDEMPQLDYLSRDK